MPVQPVLKQSRQQHSIRSGPLFNNCPVHFQCFIFDLENINVDRE